MTTIKPNPPRQTSRIPRQFPEKSSSRTTNMDDNTKEAKSARQNNGQIQPGHMQKKY